MMNALVAFMQSHAQPAPPRAARDPAQHPKWPCFVCGFASNFASRTTCYKCHANKGVGAPTPAGPQSAAAAVRPRSVAPPGGQSYAAAVVGATAPAAAPAPAQPGATSCSPDLAAALAEAKKVLDSAKAWPAEGPTKDRLLAEAQSGLAAAQAALNAAKPLGAQLQSARDRIETHSKSIAAGKEALAEARSKVASLEATIASAEAALATAEAEQAQLAAAMAEPPAPAPAPAAESISNGDLLQTLLSRCQDPDVSAIIKDLVEREAAAQPAPVVAPPLAGTEHPAPLAQEVGSAAVAAAPPGQERPPKRQCPDLVSTGGPATAVGPGSELHPEPVQADGAMEPGDAEMAVAR